MTPAAPRSLRTMRCTPGRQRHVGMREALVHAVADGAVVVERREHVLDRCAAPSSMPIDVEEGFLLAGKGGVGQVLRRGRRAHGEARLPVAGAQLREGIADRLLQVRRKRLAPRPSRGSRRRRPPAPRTSSMSRLGQPRVDALREPAVREELRGRRGRWWRSRSARARRRAAGEIISPRLAFLPPTASTSLILRFSNGTTRAVGLKSADMGKLQKLKPGRRRLGALSHGTGCGFGLVRMGRSGAWRVNR